MWGSAGDVLNISVFGPGSAPCQLRQDVVGCIKILLLMCDLRLEPGQTEKTEKADISLTRREICQNAAASDTLVPFQNVMAGGNTTP